MQNTHSITHRPTPLPQSGFTILELMIVVSILGALAAILLPAMGSAREAARRVQCTNHLREIGLALHGHHAAQKQLPVGWTFDPSTTSAFGWVVPLLPFIDEDALAVQIDMKRALDDSRHELARSTSLPWMLCPSDITEPSFTLFEGHEVDSIESDSASLNSEESIPLMQLPTANFVGIFGTIEADDSTPAPVGDGAFLENRATRFRDFLRGTSHTIIVGERTMAQVPSTWIGVSLAGEDAAARVVGSALEGINNPLADECDLSSRHPGGANFLWGDGHVTFVTENVDLREYHRWAKLRE
ncbi:hypothetical protein RISK_000156 [Rhodopirellula islandica]|uniref:DUF1559 domain-containing protein n=1 Tax=Rhodopirellula islandica TaxID=595434 RepID=A0A0J1BMV6_RHOIS|nr:DUF1559 domain-containing protein [Rhodopirellula islandica]KLU07783.1 hypothetical protein RISK_000156 [Rhodopirellula islandica]